MSAPAATPAELIQADAVDRCGRLTRRERDVLITTSKGLSAKQVASALGISPWTVLDHRRKVHQKLDVCTAIEAAVIAAKAGLV